MFNVNQLNTAKYNETSQIFDAQTAQDNIVFDGFSLQNSNIITSKITNDNIPSREYKTFKIPREDGEGINSSFYRRKTITLTGTIIGESKEDLNNRIDDFKKNTSKINGNLEIKINEEIRRYQATLINQDIINRESYNTTFVPFKLVFVVILPFGQSIDISFVEFYNITQEDTVVQIENEGTAKTSVFLTMIVNSSLNFSQVRFHNHINQEQIIINHNYVAPSVLQINPTDKNVKINGELVDYDGVFPTLEVGVNSLGIHTISDIHDFNFTAKYFKTYL